MAHTDLPGQDRIKSVVTGYGYYWWICTIHHTRRHGTAWTAWQTDTGSWNRISMCLMDSVDI